ncbi:MAG TPA: ABC transporter substrate-binding protein [Kineosporiaceae bacterium]|nr:ABC transporter substrate-binding protein [Kineosporiaceae bacterium]
MLRKISVSLAGVLVLALAACGGSSSGGAGGSSSAAGNKPLVLGFSQVGSESGWRSANTESIKSAAKDAAVDLKFSDAQQKQENQIKALRSFIQQKVSVISFSPVVTTGWDTVLKEAKDAKIPVILTDRSVDSDPSLYVTLVGSDFTQEGVKAGNWVNKEFADAATVNIAELQGTTGSAPAIERKKGFFSVVTDKKFNLIASQTGDFTRAGGKQVMTAFLKAHPDINLLFAHNDDMALGAIEAIEAAGKVPGKDIKIISIDAVHDGMQALSDGKINYIVECSPLLGPQLMDTAKKVLAGQSVEKWIKTNESEFDSTQAKTALPTRKY